eukprot:3778-Heterococcus_DN1.PRE.1
MIYDYAADASAQLHAYTHWIATIAATTIATDWRNATPEMVADAAQHGIDLTDPAVIDLMLEMEQERENSTVTSSSTGGSSDQHVASAVQQFTSMCIAQCCSLHNALWYSMRFSVGSLRLRGIACCKRMRADRRVCMVVGCVLCILQAIEKASSQPATKTPAQSQHANTTKQLTFTRSDWRLSLGIALLTIAWKLYNSPALRALLFGKDTP